MKRILFRSLALIGASLLAVSCTTTYDAAGNPVQSMDPGAAAATAIGAGVLGYAVGHSSGPRYAHPAYYGGGYGRYGRRRGWR